MRFSNKTKTIIVPLFILLFVFLMELFLFNHKAFLSMNEQEVSGILTIGSGLTPIADGQYQLTDPNNAYIEISDLDASVRYIYLDITAINSQGRKYPTIATLHLKDEGNSLYYPIGKIQTYPSFPETKYHKIHAYGNVHGIKIDISNQVTGRFNQSVDITDLKINAIRLNTSVPFFFSFFRIIVLYVVFMFLWFFRPSSFIYTHALDFSSQKQRFCVFAMIFCLILFYSIVVVGDPDKLQSCYNQYNDLAVSFSQGVSHLIKVPEDALISMDNPYDSTLRAKECADASWDHAFFNGRYYVYFGVVPVVLFYLPFYLLIGKQLQIWMLYPPLAAVCVVMFFYLIYLICKRWFSKVSFGVYSLLSIACVICSGLYLYMTNDNIYTLCPLLAIAFALSGLVFYMKASETWTKEQADSGCKKSIYLLLSLGSLCMALIAGCRPHMLICLLLCFTIFGDNLKNEKKIFSKKMFTKAFAFAFPFILVAAGLMYYNFIRFGSVFDFGSRYNLTTDDLTHRGFYWGRIIDGIYAYLFQPMNVGIQFPFVFPISVQTNYLGRIVREKMYGGIFALKPFFSLLFLLPIVKNELKEKKLRFFVWCLLISSVIILSIDAQMAGVLYRYQNDFAWMFCIAAAMIWLSLWKKYNYTFIKKGLIIFTLLSVVVCGVIEFFTALDAYTQNYDLYTYYSFARLFY